ncbi:MAG TPA: uroporphyrinogen decarboxylase family protein [Candidatus Dormibacteraeota bacterium]|nr:uroporphyrinogen decarboxylase family protein [Candidatus Dormibacteraeota bacterium]
MDSRARVEATLAGGDVDRPAAGAWGHRYRDEWSPERLAQVTVERARRFEWDFVKFQPRATFFAEAFGAAFRPAGHSLRAPVIDEPPVNSLEDWQRLRLVNPEAMDDQVRALKLVVEGLGDRVPVLQTVFSPLSVGSYLVGRENRKLVREMRANPEVVLPALDRIADALIEFSGKSVAAGAAGIFYAISGFATPDAMPVEVYDELVFPTDLRIVQALPSAAWFNVVHLCGSHVNMDVGRRLPVQAVSYSMHNKGNPALGEARRLTGKAVMGGLEQRKVLAGGPAETIERQVREAIGSTGGRGLLLAPGCSVPPRAPDVNLRTMMQAAAAA